MGKRDSSLSDLCSTLCLPPDAGSASEVTMTRHRFDAVSSLSDSHAMLIFVFDTSRFQDKESWVKDEVKCMIEPEPYNTALPGSRDHTFRGENVSFAICMHTERMVRERNPSY